VINRLVHAQRSFLAAGLLVALIPAPGASGLELQAAEPAPREEYVALVDVYRSGDTKAALQALSNRDDRWVQSAQSSILRAAPAWPRNRIEAGILLHTEAVTGGWVLPAHYAMQLGAARRLIELSHGTLVSRRFRRDWLLAVCWHYQSEMELAALVPWLDELQDGFPDDPETSLAVGMFYEGIGWSGRVPIELPWATASRILKIVPHRNQHDALEAAVAALRRAAQSPATRVEASLRLGRVLAELDRASEARAVLGPIADTAPERRWQYLAALFIARAEARANDRRAEAAAYERAAMLMPGCQTPLVGLTALRQIEGRTDDATALARSLTGGRDICDDPWWFYRFGQSPDRLPELLAVMRRGTE
jgi:hypothetical protein